MEKIADLIEMPEPSTKDGSSKTLKSTLTTLSANDLVPDWSTDGHPHQALMLQSALRYCNLLAHDEGDGFCVTISGTSGSGKTTLAQAVHRHARKHYGVYEAPIGMGGALITQTRSVLFWDASQIAGRLKRGDWHLVDTMHSAFFLALDDIGNEHDPSGFMSSVLVDMLNARRNKWTILTSNLDRQALAERYDSRFASRLNRWGNKFMRFEAPDWDV